MDIVYEGKNYILKFPGNLKEQQMKNIQLSYSNSPVCEYIGSQIYGLLGVPVHDTVLGFRNGKTVVAPVYDNGNCLNSKWDDEKMQAVLSDEKNMETEAFSARRCIFELKDRKLNSYHLIERMEYEGCNNAVRNITPEVAAALPEIEKMILGIPVLTEIQKKFYLEVMGERYEKVLKPTCHKIMEQEMEVERQTDFKEERRCR